MMMKALRYLGLSVLLVPTFSGNARAEQYQYYDDTGKFAGSYLCLAEVSGGVAYDDTSKKWTGTPFRADGKYIVKVENIGTKQLKLEVHDEVVALYSIKVSKFGESVRDLDQCIGLGKKRDEPFPFTKEGRFRCATLGTDWTVNLAAGRYLKAYLWGFTGGEDNNDNTPFVEIGLCSKL